MCVPLVQFWAQDFLWPLITLVVFAIMQGERPDPLKVFIGSLQKGIGKPKLLAWLSFFELDALEIYIPDGKGQLSVAFLTFSTAVEAQKCVQCFHGLRDVDISPVDVKAQRVAIMGVFSFFRSLGL